MSRSVITETWMWSTSCFDVVFSSSLFSLLSRLSSSLFPLSVSPYLNFSYFHFPLISAPFIWFILNLTFYLSYSCSFPLVSPSLLLPLLSLLHPFYEIFLLTVCYLINCPSTLVSLFLLLSRFLTTESKLSFLHFSDLISVFPVALSFSLSLSLSVSFFLALSGNYKLDTQ